MNIYTTYRTSFTSPPEKLSLIDVINDIKTGLYADNIQDIRTESDTNKKKKLKKLLPSFTPCLQGKMTPNHLVQLELDVQDNPKVNFEKLKQAIINIPEVIYCFESPSKGLKFALLTDFARNEGDNTHSLKERFTSAYVIAKKLIQNHINAKFDDSLKSITQDCFISFDKGAYINIECEILSLNEQCKFIEPNYSRATNNPIPSSQIEELLKFIPRDYGWNERTPINFAVFNEIGTDGIPLLLRHWATNNRSKLEDDLKSQLASTDYGSIGTLISEAKKHGYSYTKKPKEIEYRFEPLLTTEKADSKLERIIKVFFDTKKSTFLNVSTGFGKTRTALEILKEIPWNKQVLYLVPSHKLADEIIRKYRELPTPKQDETLTPFQKTLSRKGIRGITHLFGKSKLCHRSDTLKKYESKNLSMPLSECLNCSKYHISGCDYIEQFNNTANIKIMTHEQFINEQSAWFYGNSVEDGSPPKEKLIKDENGDLQVKKPNRKPDYIILDENWMNRDDLITSYDKTPYSSIQNIIHGSENGLLNEKVLTENANSILADYDKANTETRPPFLNTEQYIQKIKQYNYLTKDLDILKGLKKFVADGDNSITKRMKIYETNFYYYRMSRMASRYKDVPTLYLDATANKPIVENIIGDVDFHSIKVKANDKINLFQAQDFNVTKTWLNKSKNREALAKMLNDLKSEYAKIGFITYMNIEGIPNFDKWLSDKTGIELYEHFGNLRGVDDFEDVDCLVVIGRHLIPQYELQNYATAIFGEQIDDDSQNTLDTPIRMKDGSVMAVKNFQFNDNRLEFVKSHFCVSETIQAIGRARMIWGKPKDIIFLSKESQGADIEVTDFFSKDEVLDISKYDDAIDNLKEIGYCQNMPESLKALGLTSYAIKNNRTIIDTDFENAGIVKKKIAIETKGRKKIKREYYISNRKALDSHIIGNGGTIL